MRFAIELRYKGTHYQGFQIQKTKPTIQLAIEQALCKILGSEIRVHPSGRTDTGVHALSQTIHFDTDQEKALHRIKNQDIAHKLNCVLPDDISVLKFKKVSDEFNARYAQSKTYRYHLRLSTLENPFLKDYVWTISKDLDETVMKLAAQKLIGRHDFTSFCASDSTANTKTRHLLNIEFSHKCPAPFFKQSHETYLTIDFTGEGFLKQMVRILVGTLVDAGQGKLKVQDMTRILKAKDRKEASRTAPPQGLFLIKTNYP